MARRRTAWCSGAWTSWPCCGSRSSAKPVVAPDSGWWRRGGCACAGRGGSTMQRDTAWARARAWDPWIKTAFTAWLVVVVAVTVRGAVQPHVHSLYHTYATAGGDWVHGTTLYRTTVEPNLEAFRYSPLIAALLVPLHELPEMLGGALWRLLNAGIFLGGFLAWLRAAAPAAVTARQQGLLFLALLPLALSSLNNAQPNPLVIGLLLATAAAAARDHWNRAALWMGLAVALKVYPLAFGLLLAAAYPRRFALRLVLAVVL